jgi:enoyl-CoA hydratase/carnithine racemase
MAELEYSREGGVATVLLNRPERKNAFTLTMIDLWRDAYLEARRDEQVRVIVVRGAGDAFCAGVDLGALQSEMGNDPVSYKEFLAERVQRIPLAVEDLDKPIIASISGAAVGAGLDMALMCDLRIAGTSARLCESYINIGLVPGAGGCYYLPRIVGLAKAFELLITGDFIDAQEAQRIGLVNRVYGDEELLERTYELAERIARTPLLSLRMMKRTLYQSASTDLRTALDLVSSNMGIIRSDMDSKRALQAAQTAIVGPREAGV